MEELYEYIEVSPEIDWLEKMDGFLNWKIIGPDINNPYAPVMSDRLLTDLANRADALKAVLCLKCLCDGYEVLLVKNLISPSVRTDHPCLTRISKDEIFKYLKAHGMEERIQHEITRIQAEIKSELERRETEERENPHKKYKQAMDSRKNETKKKRAGQVYRILKK